MNRFYVNLLLLVTVLNPVLMGCSSMVGTTESASVYSGAQQTYLPLAKQLDNPKNLVLLGVKLEHTEFDLPVRINSQVEKWAEYFTTRGRKHFELYLSRSEFFIPYMRPILKKSRMPEDLVYLAMIESGFSNHAYSRARAVGPWQFIAATGKRYGLKINWWVDERRNIEKSTIAAIRYLRTLYRHFDSWELAAAAYNAGETKVAKAVRRYGTQDFWQMTRFRYLKAETRNYVPKMIAAALLAKNRTLFGFPPEGTALAAYEKDPVTEEKEVAKEANVQSFQEMMKEFDLSYGEGIRPASLLGRSFALDGQETESWEDDFVTVNDDFEINDEEFANIPIPHVSKKGELGGVEIVEFEVAGPADLFKVAKAADIPYETIKKLNPEILRWVTSPFDKVAHIKIPASSKEKFLLTYNHPEFEREVKFRTYVIKKGDSLRGISRRFGLKDIAIRDLNGLSKSPKLSVGKTILLPIPSDVSRSLSSLDLFDPPRKRHRRKRYRRSKPKKSDSSHLIQVVPAQRVAARLVFFSGS